MTVAILSGGLDSTVLAASLKAQGHEVACMSFDYGQRHRRELEHARVVAEALSLPWTLIDVSALSELLVGSALTDPAVPVPDGHYAEPSMRSTVVPNRNAIMLAIATGYAVANGHQAVAFGAHAGDHYVYPDCRPAFVSALEQALRLGNEGFAVDDFRLLAPFAEMTKTDIVRLGAKLDAPMELSWSCYRGAEWHCGTCGTCVERREAFAEAGVADPTAYEPALA
jgi:7-cyano-7-deazaguanine synthase